MRRSEKFLENLAKLRVEIVEDFCNLADYMLTHGRIGVGKVVDEGSKIRAVSDDCIEEYVGTLPIVYTEKARIVLYDVLDLMEIKKFRYSTNDIYTQPPLYARAGEYYGTWAYVDIRSAYPSIYQYFLNVKYRRLKYLSDAVITPFTELKGRLSKRVRNSIFGVMRASKIRRYTNNGKLIFNWITVAHGLLNPDLVNLTYDVLQSIAHRAIKDFGAIYFNTDGTILPVRKVEDYTRFLETLGFEANIKVIGENAIVKTCNAYKIGDYETLSYKYVKFFKDFSNLIAEEEAKWVLNIYSRKVQKVL